MVYNYEKSIRALPYPFIQITSGYKIRCRFTLTQSLTQQTAIQGKFDNNKNSKNNNKQQNTMDEIIGIITILLIFML